ncbi:N-methyl-L-tryptophan oxidase [Terribacillus sp. 7520-G]|uniref:N-methyl-L-tryptophan oxidase n=1 Tax=Terribacillus TaxID=459532 RepID=UPI000BA5DF39|nr:N-methyl-L-tryptophan oxidase [Terribacillus sp. 7520-G]PAD40198.1 N-methyltryptophan oxidase [Terribacillus sp. 7520-G]
MLYDVIILGAGTMGLSAGYQLAKKGQKVLMVDSYHPPHVHGSHHGETRIIRYAYGEGEAYVPFALRSKELWKDLEGKIGRTILVETGVLNCGPESSPFIQNVLKSGDKYALQVEKHTSAQLQKRWPGLTIPNDYIGAYEKDGGYLRTDTILNGYAELAVSYGAVLAGGQRVREVKINKGTVALTTADTTYKAKKLIVTAGAWGGEVLSQLGLQLPITVIRKTFAWLHADAIFQESKFPCFSFDTEMGTYYGFPDIDGTGLKIGRHDTGMPIHPDKKGSPFQDADTEELLAFLSRFMARGTFRLREGKTCMYSMTPDEDFIIDHHPEHQEVMFALGFSGHGFKFASAAGEALSEMAMEKELTVDMEPFRLDRF